MLTKPSSNEGRQQMMIDCTGRVVTRVAETEAAYQTRFQALMRMAKRENAAADCLVGFVEWFVIQNECWAPATVRHYRAAILHGIEARVHDTSERAALAERVRSGPLPKEKGPKRTSARKRKSLPQDEYLRLVKYLGDTGWPDDALIRGFLIAGPVLFPRPVEYVGAYIEGARIFIKNAKATNGRANGEFRDLEISHLEPGAIAVLAQFLDQLRQALSRAGSWKKLSDRLASRLARVCETLKIQRVSFYTLRHSGIATAKTWMEPRDVAAAAGHASVRTATSHYAKRRTGWSGLKIAGKPSAATIARVRGEAKFFSPKPPTMSPG